MKIELPESTKVLEFVPGRKYIVLVEHGSISVDSLVNMEFEENIEGLFIFCQADLKVRNLAGLEEIKKFYDEAVAELYKPGEPGAPDALLTRLFTPDDMRAAVLAERERCAVVAEGGLDHPEDAARAIRASFPKLESLRGISPNATGDLSSEDFVRNIRREWKD